MVDGSTDSLKTLLLWARDVIEHQRRTPVLVTPEDIRLRTAFFVEVGRQWLSIPKPDHVSPEHPPTLWMDWCPYSSCSSGSTPRLASIHVHRIRWSLRLNRLAPAVQLHTRALPTRIAGTDSVQQDGRSTHRAGFPDAFRSGDCILAVARESLRLPSWAAAFRLVA